MEAITDQSLIRSLDLITHLLDKELGFTQQQIISTHKQVYAYPHRQPLPIHSDDKAHLFTKTLAQEGIGTSNNHPFDGLPVAIKFYASVPLISSAKKNLGFLLLLNENEYHLSAKETSLLEGFAQIISDTIERQQENQRLQQVFTDFMHKAIHDLKNPLTSISLTSELLKRKAEDPKMVINFSEKLEKASQRLFSNLEKLKSAFPVEDNHFKLAISEINLEELFNDIKNTVNKIHISTENKVDRNIYADYNRLKEAVMLLISEASSTGIDITIKSYDSEQQTIIEISSPKANYPNRSTCLTISKTLIEMHGGTLTTENGTASIYLPSANL